MSNPLWWLALLLAVVGAVFMVAALNALLRRRVLRSGAHLLLAVALFGVGAAFAALALGVQGYRTLTREEVAATVHVEPTGAKRFRARLIFPDGRELTYLLMGDEFYIDARVLKWHPWANIVGLHTAYELDRVAGRYLDVAEEQREARTVFALGRERPVDVFGLRRRYALLSPLLDAEYGSATFSAADAPAVYEVRVSTTGLLLRRLEPAG
jgi:hypothetical protein